MDDLSEETSYVTYTLHLFNTPISPPISIFSPPSSTLIPSPHYSSMERDQRAISPPSLIPLPPTVLPPSIRPALPAPPRVEALPAPPQIFLSETLRGMISRKNSTVSGEEMKRQRDHCISGGRRTDRSGECC